MTRNSAPRIVVAFVSTVALPRAPNAVWLPPPPPNALAMSPPLPLLQQDHEQEEQAHKHVNRRQREGHDRNLLSSYEGDYTVAGRLLAIISKKLAVSKLAPPTSAPSTSGCAIRSRMLSGLTLPP